jgi:ABC-type branched-subunit amino acid transport system substrate-binding protein
MGRIRTLLALPFVLALFLAACSSSGDDDDVATGDDDGDTTTTVADEEETPDGEVPEGSTVGITDDTINMSVLFADTAALAEAGLVPDIGDPLQDYQVFADLANEEGGAGGRNITVTSHLYPPGSTATDQQPACVQATEDDEAAFIVFVGGFAAETVLCVTEEHERVALAQAGVIIKEIYDRSQGRFFAHGMMAEREMQGWVVALEKHGDLEGKTFGIIRADQPDHEAAAEALTAALEDAGYEVAENIALPCEATACTQNETAVERFQSSGVDAVFSLLSAIPNPTFIGAADAAGFDPQWFASDFENQVFDVTAQFMESVKGPYDGAIGFTYGLEEPETDEYGEDCNARFTEVTGITYEYDTDAWRQVRSACYTVDEFVTAANYAMDEYGVLNAGTLVKGFESQPEYALGDQFGSWSETKHDAADSVVLKTMGADCLCWTEIEGTRDAFSG